MKVTITHKKTQQEAISVVDKGADSLFAGAGGPSVQITDQKKEWVGSTMNFSFTARMGFIAVPLTGTVDVGEHDIVVDCELPNLIKNFIGDGKVKESVEKKIQLLLQ